MTTKLYTLTSKNQSNHQTPSLRGFLIRSTVILLVLSFLGLVLFSQNPFSGRIVDTETGIPLPYATVSLPGTSPLMETVTDENGLFEFMDVPTGEHTIEVNYMDYEPLIVTGVKVGMENQESVVLNMQEERLRNGDLFTQTLSGRVMDAESNLPVPYALVTLPGTTPQMEAVTDEYGYFTIKNVPAGSQALEVHTMDYETYVLPRVHIPLGKKVVAPLKIKEKTQQAISHPIENLIF